MGETAVVGGTLPCTLPPIIDRGYSLDSKQERTLPRLRVLRTVRLPMHWLFHRPVGAAQFAKLLETGISGTVRS
jgi:hypothetical protein